MQATPLVKNLGVQCDLLQFPVCLSSRQTKTTGVQCDLQPYPTMSSPCQLSPFSCSESDVSDVCQPFDISTGLYYSSHESSDL